MSEQSDFGTFGRYIETAVDQMSPEMRDAYDFTKSLRGIVPGRTRRLLLWMSGWFLAVSIETYISDASLSPFTRLMMCSGLPTVSCPYIPAAEIPMPCWPRDWLSL